MTTTVKVSKEQFIQECHTAVINWNMNNQNSLPIRELCPVLNCNSFVTEGIEENYNEELEEIENHLWSERVDVKGYEYID